MAICKSIIQKTKECAVCRTQRGLHNHHVFFGPLRPLADQDGMTVWLCYEHHQGNTGVHFNKALDNQIKAAAQKIWEQTYGDRSAFIKRYGRSYI